MAYFEGCVPETVSCGGDLPTGSLEERFGRPQGNGGELDKSTKSLQSEMESGSRIEGFRFKESDWDTTHWQNNLRVIWNIFQVLSYHEESLFLSDCSNSPPGFTLLQLLTSDVTYPIPPTCIVMNGKLYLSSSKYRGMARFGIKSRPNLFQHGPCNNGNYRGLYDYDDAHCLFSDFWPPSATSWVDRCQSWPKPRIVHDIVRNGCHCVAIGHKLGNHYNTEWRISFSLAEQILVNSMNHCQFLVYGLLKIYLKEVINNGLDDKDKLLCSYHVKTAVFWMIQTNIMPFWCPENLLECFWLCFKLIIKWVYQGYCPNFFISENNMFLSNIHGEAQQDLFTRLYGLYEKGLASLLHSACIGSFVIKMLFIPGGIICTNDRKLISEIRFDAEVSEEIQISSLIPTKDLYHCLKALHTVEQIRGLCLTEYQAGLLQALTVHILQGTAFVLADMYPNRGTNKVKFITDKISRNMLKLTSKFGFISDMLYFAIFYYKTFRWIEALSVLEITKGRLAQPYLMYDNNVNKERYIEAVGGLSWSTKIRKALAKDVTLHNDIINIYINELVPEQQNCMQNNETLVSIPPFVLLHMLEVLCYKHIDIRRAHTALYDLQVLVQYNREGYIDDAYKDISWQILGICQQVCGNLQAALDSYHQSLQQYPNHQIQTATEMRIRDLLQRFQ
ncbi:uncharacterized protein LOC133176047 [Saccostrea echinata]|uniref:uncharacterized protein LOC133176047 n=1 Tax=Saccostrea echinata TaxID=191078 RepID=UPI002A82C876|nr:uncharacterized protein LOC133176047 [Saccostrea echinata]